MTSSLALGTRLHSSCSRLFAGAAVAAFSAAVLAPSGCAPTPIAGIGPRSTVNDAEQLTARAVQELTRGETGAGAGSGPDAARQARVLLVQALDADPFHGPALNNLGVLELREGRLRAAADAFDSAAKVMPGHPDPRMNRGLVNEAAGRFGDALADYSTALEVAPWHLPAMQALVSLQLRTGRTNPLTRERLDRIALAGTTPSWRLWARDQSLRGPSPSSAQPPMSGPVTRANDDSGRPQGP